MFWRLNHQEKVGGTAGSLLYVTKTTQNEYHRVVVRGAMGQAKRAGIQLHSQAPLLESDYQSQERFILQAIESNTATGVILAPNHSAYLISSLDRLEAAGINFVVVDTPISIPDGKVYNRYCGFVGTNNVLGGRLAARYIGKKVVTGSVLVVRGVQSHRTSMDREKGFIDELKNHTGLQIAGIINGEWHPDVAVSELKRFLRGHPQRIHAIFSYNDPMMLAISKMYADNPARPLLVGFNGDLEVQRAILAGSIDATVAQAPELMGRLAVDALIHCRPGAVTLTPVSLILSRPALTTLSTVE